MIRKTLLASLGASALILTACGDSTGDTDTDAATTTATTTGDTPTTGDTATTGAPVTCNVCADYGAAVPQVASDITDKAPADPMFMADFAPLVAEGTPAVDEFKTSLANFISDASKCTPDAYKGPTMEPGAKQIANNYTTMFSVVAIKH